MSVNDYNVMIAILREAPGDAHAPRYRAIANALIRAISSGDIAAESKLPPLRLLSYELSVSMATVMRVYAEVERLGLAVSRVGDGTYVRSPGPEHERLRFRNEPADAPGVVDLTRNTHISGDETAFQADLLRILAEDRALLSRLNEYGPAEGLPWHRRAGALWLRFSGRDVDENQVIVTGGSQHGLVCALMATIKPRECIATECLSYPGLIDAARMLDFDLIGLALDRDGLIPDALEAACRQRRVSALYASPTIHNPTAARMPPDRQRAIANLCQRHNVLIVEDDAHGLLADDHAPSFADFASERTVTLSGLTKAVSPGLRIGFAAAPPDLMERIAAAIRSSCWMVSPFPAEIAATWILDGTADYLRNEQRREIRRRKSLVTPILAKLDVRSREDCCHFWITLPPPLKAEDAAKALALDGVLVKAAEAFRVGQSFAGQCLRVSVSGPAEDEALVRGFGAIAAAVTA